MLGALKKLIQQDALDAQLQRAQLQCELFKLKTETERDNTASLSDDFAR